MQNFEVEIKSLLGSPERADEVRRAMKEADPACILRSKSKQLNHYFEGGALLKLYDMLAPHLSPTGAKKLKDISARAQNFSVRTRLTGEEKAGALIVIKVSVGDDTSANGVSRMEFEEKTPLSLEQLDAIVLSAGFTYQAKWSREREEYQCLDITVTLDKNAGYGWLAEFEIVVDDQAKITAARHKVESLMTRLGVEELKQDRLERMFAYYNAHWPEYYETDKIFVVE